MMQHRRPDAGFTMIEVMISLVITAIAVLGMMGLYKTQTTATAFSRHNGEAAVLAEDKIEKLRTLGTAANLGPTTENNVDAEGNIGTGAFTRTYTETLVGTTYADILVTVSWTDDAVTHTVTMRAKRNQ